jgi:nickel-type superoxide dismutase maturation protease
MRILIAAALLIGAAALLLRGRLPVTRFVVQGPSMEPAYRAGDRLLVRRLAYGARPPRPGDAVVLRDPQYPERLLLKRVTAVIEGPDDPGPRYFVTGDNPSESRDSRHFGAVPATLIVGTAWRRY